MKQTNFVTLFYCTEDREYKFEQYMKPETWEPEWYYAVQSVPQSEMLGHTEDQIVEGLIQKATFTTWISQGRRPMRSGDIISIGHKPWLLGLYLDFKNAKMQYKRLTIWPHFAIMPLSGAKAKKLCTQMI